MRKKKVDNKNIRYIILKAILLFMATIVSVRLFQIQILNHSRYKAEARRQQFQGNIIPSQRGTIFTSDGYPVAQSILSYTFYLSPDKVENKKIVVSQISDIVLMPKEEILGLLESNFSRVKIAGGLNIFQKDQIERLGIDGAFFEQSYQRFYPEGNMLSHVLGFVGKDKNGFETGYYGIEQFYDGDLLGKPGESLQERSASGKIILWGKEDNIPPVEGSSVYLTIDRTVQFIIEKYLKDGVEKYSAVSGSVIVVDPKSGKVLGMAGYPDFFPPDYTKHVDNKEILRNNTISTVYEPGSVIKAITMASAIDSGKVTYNSTYEDIGPRIFSGHKVDNWDGKHHGVETMTSILQHSNNLGMAWVGMQLGDNDLLDYFNNFGLGRKLGIDLDGEESGITYKNPPLKDIEIVNASFGQGISFTPLQVTMAFSSLANGGYLMRPKIVDYLVDHNGNKSEIRDEILSRPVSNSTAETMIKMLTDAASGGEAKFFITKKYNVAGKTGTAQVPVSGGYDPERTNATFVGFLPSYRNFVLFVKLEEPKFPSGYAAETAVPLWMRISEELANHYSLPPDK